MARNKWLLYLIWFLLLASVVNFLCIYNSKSPKPLQVSLKRVLNSYRNRTNILSKGHYRNRTNILSTGRQQRHKQKSWLPSSLNETTNEVEHARIVIAVFSGHKNFKRREAVRNYWKKLVPSGIPVVFFVGKGPSSELVKLEQRKFHDIVVLDTVDTYKRSSVKLMKMFQHIVKEYGGYKAAIKFDDDVLPNVVGIIKRMKDLIIPEVNTDECQYWWWGSFRWSSPMPLGSRWYVPPENHVVIQGNWPLFAGGWGHMISMSALAAIVNSTQNLPIAKVHGVWMEDVAVAIWFDMVLKRYSERKVCRFDDVAWMSNRLHRGHSRDCKRDILVLDEIVHFEREGGGGNGQRLVNDYFIHWDTLKKCSHLCGCERNFAPDNIVKLVGPTKHTVGLNNIGLLMQKKMIRIRDQKPPNIVKSKAIGYGTPRLVVGKGKIKGIGYAIITGCKRWHIIGDTVKRLQNSSVHIFGNCNSMRDFDPCHSLHGNLNHVFCHVEEVVDTNMRMNRRLVLHYKKIFWNMFHRYDYAVFLEDDLMVSDKISKFFKWSKDVMHVDESIFCASAWSDNAINEGGPFRILRQEHFGGLGWMMSSKTYHNIVRSHFEDIAKIGDLSWDGVLSKVVVKENTRRKQKGLTCLLECLRPSIALSHHASTNTHITLHKGSGLYSQTTFDRMPLAMDSTVNITIPPDFLSCKSEKLYRDIILSNPNLKIECINARSNSDPLWTSYMRSKHNMFGVGFMHVVRGVHDGSTLIYSHGYETLVIAKYSTIYPMRCVNS